jgi:hypothetical protein
MSWAIARESGDGLWEALMILEDRREAEELVRQVPVRGQRLGVRPYPDLHLASAGG